MYIPQRFQFSERAELVAFMRAYSFATIITVGEGGRVVASHLPFVVEETAAGEILLTSHFARANAQWCSLETGEVLVVFAEPHAYISPQHYEKTLNVPTWNYVAVHAYTSARLIREEGEVFAVLEKMIQQYEANYQKQWSMLPQDYKDGLAKGIMAFELRVTDLQASRKLSQNKTENERQRIAQALETSSDSPAQKIGELMRQDLQKKPE